MTSSLKPLKLNLIFGWQRYQSKYLVDNNISVDKQKPFMYRHLQPVNKYEFHFLKYALKEKESCIDVIKSFNISG